MSNLKICFVYPNRTIFPKWFDKTDSFPREPSLLPPLGMLYIIANSDYKIDFIDNRTSKYSDQELYNKLKDYDVVGFGGTVGEALQAKNLSKVLRANNIKTIYGGPNATMNWQKYVHDFDFIVKGEGEITMNKLLNCIKEGGDPKDIPGIVFSSAGGHPPLITDNPDMPFIKDLDTLAYPARELVNLQKYWRTAEPWLKIKPVDTIIASRGCPFGCKFCAAKNFWKRSYRIRKPEEVVEEIKYMKKEFGTKGVYFREDLFTFSKDFVMEFCKLAKPLKIEWVCESRIDTVDEQMLKEMKKSGCKAINFGIESCSNVILKFINKDFTFQQIQEKISFCKKLGIFVGAGFIVGLPNETRDDIIENIMKSKKLGINYVCYNRFLGIPKSELYELVKKEGLMRYEYEDVLIPDTRYLHADRVTKIYYKSAHSFLSTICRGRPLWLPSFIKKWAHSKFPTLYSKLRKAVYNLPQ